MTTVLKLGGSVVTKKDEPETVEEKALADAAAAIADSPVEAGESDESDEAGESDESDEAGESGDLVVVHGGGSFGHHHAAERGVSASAGTRDAGDVTAIHDAMGRLNSRVVAALQDAGVPALPVRPLSVASRSADGALSVPTGAVETMLAEGFVPVLHGDVVVHAGEGATIASGDDIVVDLAGSLSADRVGLCSTVPGVLDADGEVIPVVENFADVADAVGASDATDVTGGMAAKVEKLLALDSPASIFGPGDLRAFLDGDSPGTRIE